MPLPLKVVLAVHINHMLILDTFPACDGVWACAGEGESTRWSFLSGHEVPTRGSFGGRPPSVSPLPPAPPPDPYACNWLMSCGELSVLATPLDKLRIYQEVAQNALDAMSALAHMSKCIH